MTGGRKVRRLFGRGGRCRVPFDRLLSSESRGVSTSLLITSTNRSTRSRRLAIARELEAQAALGPALARCLSSAGYRGVVTGKDVGKI